MESVVSTAPPRADPLAISTILFLFSFIFYWVSPSLQLAGMIAWWDVQRDKFCARWQRTPRRRG